MGTNSDNEHIIEMEQLFARILKAQDTWQSDKTGKSEEYLKLQSVVRKLEEYYESPLWKRDFERDERGEIPKDIARGVLSEDGIYNMLEENREILATIVGSSRIAVVFPGIGYHSDKPLLYYSKKLAREAGYIIVEITYEFPHKPGDIKGNADRMKNAFEIAAGQATEQLSPLKLDQCGDVLFIGKSIGTAVAAYYNEQNKTGARQIVFTPVPQTFDLLMAGNALASQYDDKTTGASSGSENSDFDRSSVLHGGAASDHDRPIVFHGSADPWCDTKLAVDRCKELGLPLYITDNANHSLETGSVLADIANLQTILGTVSDYIKVPYVVDSL